MKIKRILLLIIILFNISCGLELKNNKTLVLNLEGEPATIDPQKGVTNDLIDFNGNPIDSNRKDKILRAISTVNELISEGLLKKNKNNEIVGGLAEKWEISEDGLEWIFHLRDGIKWSNGDPITANDFKTGWIRALDPDNSEVETVYMLYPIKNAEEFNKKEVTSEDLGIEVLDEKTLKVTLKEPTPYFDRLLTFKAYMPANEKFLQEKEYNYFEENPENIISSGAYIIKEWIHDSEIKLEKNPNYYDAENVKVDNVVLKLIPDLSERLNLFKNRKVDITAIIPEQSEEFENDKKLQTINDGSVWYMLFNTKNKILSNKKIRKALLMAVNREEMIKEQLWKTGKIAKTFVPSGIGIKGLNKADFTEEVATSISDFNPEEARKLLDEGLREIGITKIPTLEILFNDWGENKVIAEYIQESFNKNLGINLELVSDDYKERISKIKSQQFDIVLDKWIGKFEDPVAYLDLFETNGENNIGKYSNLRYDNLLKISRTSINPKERYAAMHELEKIISEDIPVGVLYHGELKYLVDSKAKELKIKPINGMYDVSNLLIEK